MCRVMFSMGIAQEDVRKVWNRADPTDPDSRLVVKTRNHPKCKVEWEWHVAPTVTVRTRWFPLVQELVIDPALFKQPVAVATWRGVQGDPNSALSYSGHEQYLVGQIDPTYSSTAMFLELYRTRLLLRASKCGAPPYSYCP